MILASESSRYSCDLVEASPDMYDFVLYAHDDSHAVVSIFVDDRDRSIALQKIGFYEECELDAALQNLEATIAAVRAALRIVVKWFPRVQSISIADETFCPSPKRPLITARRLLLNRPGLFEEHLGARASGSTVSYLRFLRAALKQHPDIARDIRANAEDPFFFTADNVAELCARIRVRPALLIKTSWTLPASVVRQWPAPTVLPGGTNSCVMKHQLKIDSPWETQRRNSKAMYY